MSNYFFGDACDVMSHGQVTGIRDIAEATREARNDFELPTKSAVRLSKPSFVKASLTLSASIRRCIEARYSERKLMERIIHEDDRYVTISKFEKWLESAPVGSRIVYYTGLLAADRESVAFAPQYNGFVHVLHEPIHTLGLMAWLAYERGIVTLVQKRAFNNAFDYIAFKRKQRKDPHVKQKPDVPSRSRRYERA